MFAKGEYIVCHNIGVCLVEDITKQDMNEVDQNQLYYVLQPVDCKDSKVYLAVDNDKIAMRKVISYDEVHEFMEQLGNISTIEINDEKVGIYKNPNGKIFAVKPICTHLGCLLSWNDVDKTWDCPCHGSRFNFEGINLYDPAFKDLEVYDLDL